MCVVFNLELAALACSTAVFFLCEHQRYQYVKQWKIELCTTQRWKQAFITASFYSGFVCF